MVLFRAAAAALPRRGVAGHAIIVRILVGWTMWRLGTRLICIGRNAIAAVLATGWNDPCSPLLLAVDAALVRSVRVLSAAVFACRVLL